MRFRTARENRGKAASGNRQGGGRLCADLTKDRDSGLGIRDSGFGTRPFARSMASRSPRVSSRGDDLRATTGRVEGRNHELGATVLCGAAARWNKPDEQHGCHGRDAQRTFDELYWCFVVLPIPRFNCAERAARTRDPDRAARGASDWNRCQAMNFRPRLLRCLYILW